MTCGNVEKGKLTHKSYATTEFIGKDILCLYFLPWHEFKNDNGDNDYKEIKEKMLETCV